jgi:Flp pilus assembly pilin Flp
LKSSLLHGPSRRKTSELDICQAPEEYLHGGRRGVTVTYAIRSLWRDEKGQDIAEYAVMLAVILVLVIGTIRLVGTNANTTFSRVASSIQ